MAGDLILAHPPTLNLGPSPRPRLSIDLAAADDSQVKRNPRRNPKARQTVASRLVERTSPAQRGVVRRGPPSAGCRVQGTGSPTRHDVARLVEKQVQAHY